MVCEMKQADGNDFPILRLLYAALLIIDTVKGKGKVVPVLLTELHVAKAYCGSGGIAPRIL